MKHEELLQIAGKREFVHLSVVFLSSKSSLLGYYAGKKTNIYFYSLHFITLFTLLLPPSCFVQMMGISEEIMIMMMRDLLAKWEKHGIYFISTGKWIHHLGIIIDASWGESQQ